MVTVFADLCFIIRKIFSGVYGDAKTLFLNEIKTKSFHMKWVVEVLKVSKTEKDSM